MMILHEKQIIVVYTELQYFKDFTFLNPVLVSGSSTNKWQIITLLKRISIYFRNKLALNLNRSNLKAIIVTNLILNYCDFSYLSTSTWYPILFQENHKSNK